MGKFIKARSNLTSKDMYIDKTKIIALEDFLFGSCKVWLSGMPHCLDLKFEQKETLILAGIVLPKTKKRKRK